uniref:Uncharacterized protein n=1 Tax=Dactylella tenuis TaxID=383872 RepID=A0A4Y5MZL0_9PEZI|nr:hypothetical protein [Dactylella tenuis]QCW06816.1 hypothetical protein [Dactylella tenuis]
MNYFIKSLKNKHKSVALSLSNINFTKNSLCEEGLKIIRDIKARMNTNRLTFVNPSVTLTTKRMMSTSTKSKILELYTNKPNKIPKKSNLTTSDNILDEKSLLPKHQPASVVEWNQSVYSYDKNELRNLKFLHMIISRLIKIYFSSIPMFVRKKMYNVKRRLITNKVYLSSPTFKHTSSKILVTLYFFAEQGKYNINDSFQQKYKVKKNILRYFNVDYLLKNIDKNTFRSIIHRVWEAQLWLFKTKINSYWLDGILEKDKLQFFKANYDYLKEDWFKKSLVYYNDIINSISKIIKVIMLVYKLKLRRLDIDKLELRNIISKWINVLINNYPVKWIGKSQLRERLSNSGNTFKTFVPSCYWKIISGWTNYSCEVINLKIFENTQRKGNRGSKLVVWYDTIVKEQRIYGNEYKVNTSVLKIYSNKIFKNFFNHNPFIKIYKDSYFTSYYFRLININQTVLRLNKIKPNFFGHINNLKYLPFCAQSQCRYLSNISKEN